MRGLNNSRYEELLAILEQQEEEKEQLEKARLLLEKELEAQLCLNGEINSEIRNLKDQQRRSLEESERLHGEIRMVREENRQLSRRLDGSRKANTELRKQSEEERKRSASDCRLLGQKVKLLERDFMKLKGVLLAALLYNIMVTVFQAVKDGEMPKEIREGSIAMWMMAGSGARGLMAIAEAAAIQSRMRTTGLMQVVSYHLTKVSVCLLISSLVAVPSLLLLRKIYRFYRKRMVNLPVLMATAVSLALVVWFGTIIQRVIPISRMEMLAQTQIAMVLSREYY